MPFLGLEAGQWLNIGISVGILVIALLLSRWLVTLIVRRGLGWATQRTLTTLDDNLISALEMPLRWLLMVMVLEFSINRLDFWRPSVEHALDNIFFIAY